MLKTRKKNCKVIRFVAIWLVLYLSLCSCQASSLIGNLIGNPHKDTASNELQMHEYHLSNKICETVFGMDSQSFCESKGKGTLLENGYASAIVTADETLVLQLTDSQLDRWKNSSIQLQILQKILGKEKEIVSKIIVPTDPIAGTLYEDADVHCGFEISEDYSKIIAGPGDDKSYFLVVPKACLLMQVLQGVPSDKISVEYLEIDSNSRVTKRMCLPMYMSIFQDLDECKLLKWYEQTAAAIDEYLDPKVDKSYKGLEYQSFWGMKYRSENLSYEIFAYEFNSKDNALKYYIDATGDDKYADRLPVEDSNKNILWLKTFRDNEYQIIVIEGNKAYKLVSSNLIIDKIDEMLSVVFSVKV